MNFTRDPIIETVITPREGCKLVIRSSKDARQQEYLVDAIEVVSFGHSFFYRSTERPKSFLVPVCDYEVFEAKEPKLSLKNASLERSIKIGGGKEPSKKSEDEPQEKKPKKRKSKKKTEAPLDEKPELPKEEAESKKQKTPVSKDESAGEEKTSFISKLFPPPSTLIKETISKYKSIDPVPTDLILPEIQEETQELNVQEDLSKEDEQ